MHRKRATTLFVAGLLAIVFATPGCKKTAPATSDSSVDTPSEGGSAAGSSPSSATLQGIPRARPLVDYFTSDKDSTILDPFRPDNATPDFGEDVAVVPLCDGDVGRRVYRNDVSTAMRRYMVEPRFVATVIASPQPELLCFRVKLDVPGYRRQVLASLPKVDGEDHNDIRFVGVLQPLSAIVNLAPTMSAGEVTPYAWSSPFKMIKTKPQNTESVCFEVPSRIASGDVALRALAEKSQLVVDYEYRAMNTKNAGCRARITAASGSTLSNVLTGTASGVKLDAEVYVTRRQLANLMTSQKVSVALACHSDRGSEQISQVVGKQRDDLVRMLVSNFEFQRKSWDEVQSKIASYSYDGSDAKTKITKYVDEFKKKLKEVTEREGKLKTAGEIFNIAKAELDAQYKGHDEREEQSDVRLEREGDKVVPPSLDVAVIRTGSTELSADLSIREVSILEKGIGSARIRAPIRLNDDCSVCSEYRISSAGLTVTENKEIGCGKIVFENGAKVVVSPGKTLRIDAEVIVVEGIAEIFGQGVAGADRSPKEGRGEWCSDSEKYQKFKSDCCLRKDCAMHDIGFDGDRGGDGSNGANVIFAVPPQGNLLLHLDGGRAGHGGAGGRGKVAKDCANPTADGNTCEAPGGHAGSDGQPGKPGRRCVETEDPKQCADLIIR